MWAHGLKRKLDQDGEEEDGVAAPLRPHSPLMTPPPPYNLQRQLVLNMSLLKLYGPHGGGSGAANLSLQRRVLINNVVRRIHEDFRREGEEVVSSALFLSTAAAAPPAVDNAFSCLTPASLLEDDIPVFFTVPLSPSPPSSPAPTHSQFLTLGPTRPPPTSPSVNDSFSSALEEIEELCPPFASPPVAAARLVFDVVMKEERRSQQATPPAPPHPPSTSFLTDFALDDVLFTDIDTSMYDLCPPGLLPSQSPAALPPGAPPSKLMAEGLVRSVSAFSPGGAGSQNQSLRMDLTELDHIMEVLVGS